MNFNILKVIMAVLLLIGMAVTCFPGLSEAAIVAVENNSCVVVIDPGHGGIDPGKIGTASTLEKDVNLEISLILKEKLIKEGYEVKLTRENDEGLYEENDSNKKTADMRKRCEIIENVNADIVISIHQNSFTDSKVSGAQVFYYRHSTEGKKLADCIQKELINQADKTNRRESKANDSYYMLIHTPCPTVIVECGFLSNPDEENKLISEEYQNLIADAVTTGIRDYLQ